MTYAHAAAQESLDAELDEWGQQRAQIEDERQELKRRGTPVDFMELNNRTCRWPRMQIRPSPGEHSVKPRQQISQRRRQSNPRCSVVVIPFPQQLPQPSEWRRHVD
jgi:hypothetical protein